MTTIPLLGMLFYFAACSNRIEKKYATVKTLPTEGEEPQSDPHQLFYSISCKVEGLNKESVTLDEFSFSCANINANDPCWMGLIETKRLGKIITSVGVETDENDALIGLNIGLKANLSENQQSIGGMQAKLTFINSDDRSPDVLSRISGPSVNILGFDHILTSCSFRRVASPSGGN